MDAGLITGILSVVAAAIPLLIYLFALFRGRNEQTTEPLDSRSLKVLTLVRHPTDKANWRRAIKKFLIRNAIYILLLPLFYYIIYKVIATAVPEQSDIYIPIITTIGALFFLTIIYSLANSVFYKFENLPVNARYNWFEKAEIIIQAEYDYLFNKCHETLRNMHFKVIEVDERGGTIQATYLPKFLFIIPIVSWHNGWLITVQLKEVENSENSYSVELEIKSKSSGFFKSKTINRFMNLLISRPKRQLSEPKA